MSLAESIAEIERALENPLAEPRVELGELEVDRNCGVVSLGRRLISLYHRLKTIYEGMDRCILRNVDKQTPEMCLEAVGRNAFEILYVTDQSPEICLMSVKSEPYLIRYMMRQTPGICLEAVRQDGDLLKYVAPEHKTVEVCLAAIDNSAGWAIRHIENQKPEYCFAALTKNGLCFEDMKEEYRTREVIEFAIRKNPSNISRIDNPSEELQLEAVCLDGEAIRFIRGKKSPAVYLAAIRQNPLVLKFIAPKHQTPEICLEAVKGNGLMLHLVKNQTPEICEAAIAKNPKFTRYVRDKSMLK